MNDGEWAGSGPSPMGSFQAISGVYALIDPRTDRVMYVGQSVDVEYRFRQHCNPREYRESNVEKAAWVNALAAEGLVPRLDVVVECAMPDMDDLERQAIRGFKALGQCELNVAPGGKAISATRMANSHPDDWFHLGLEIKRAREHLFEASHEAMRLAGKPARNELQKVMAQLDRAKLALEVAMRRAHPEWTHISQIFSGPLSAVDEVSRPKRRKDEPIDLDTYE